MSTTTGDTKKTPTTCSRGIREVLSMVGDKWSMLIVVTLQNGPVRFRELGRQVDTISQRMADHFRTVSLSQEQSKAKVTLFSTKRRESLEDKENTRSVPEIKLRKKQA